MHRNYIKYYTPLVALLACSAFAQPQVEEEIAEAPGMKDLMALMVRGKYKMKEASATPWEYDNIIVTSAHIDAYVENEICNDADRDVKFVQSKADFANWREPVSYEGVEYIGRIEILSEDRTFDMVMNSKSQGKVLHKTVLGFRGQVTNNFWIGSGFTVKGMSGGPVVAKSDGKVVGIIVGAVSKSVKRFDQYREKYGQDLTVVVPYSTVYSVWQGCRNEQTEIDLEKFLR